VHDRVFRLVLLKRLGGFQRNSFAAGGLFGEEVHRNHVLVFRLYALNCTLALLRMT
jgi:hypothetical protein